jgi:hypothetical protein
MATVLALSLIFVAAASADSVTTDFETMSVGSVNAQDGWKALGPYDQGVVAPGIDSGKALRVSSAQTSGSFGDWVFSKPTAEPASETGANKVFKAQFTFQALGESPVDFRHPSEGDLGSSWSHVSISADNGEGSRMSYVRLEDTRAGVLVFFDDVPNRDSNVFNERWIATLDRSNAHTIRFEMSLAPGEDNDVVTVYVDGAKKVCGASWENYYRYDEEQSPANVVSPIDRLIIQARGQATDFTGVPQAERGFLVDNVSTTTAASGGPEACPLPTGPTGPAGAPGAAGTTGAAGATTTIMTGASAVAPKLIGNTKRTIHVPLRKGERLLSARATLRNKRLPVHGRHITVDLRGKVVGNYNVFIVARYKTKSGKVHVHLSHRSLSVTRALSEAPTSG